jgi:hypothetical protein
MVIKNALNNALKTPMSRREFLGQVGAVMLAVVGFSAVMHALSGQHSLHGNHAISEGYGAAPYGGNNTVQA